MEPSGKRVLIVEDDHLLLMVASKFVQKLGHEVVATANNGRSALENIDTHKPDIILMDIGLKGDWDGIETVKQIKSQYTIPVIYLSASSYPESRERAQEVGYEGFLEKPLQIYELAETFKKVLGAKDEPPHANRRKTS